MSDTPVLARRCLHHPGREAAARCPECREFFCRECVVEHGDRVICAACLARVARRDASGRRGPMARLGRLLLPLAGLLLGWFFFYLLAQALLALPDTFHATAVPEDAAAAAGPAPQGAGQRTPARPAPREEAR
jgi:hypothetical protein